MSLARVAAIGAAIWGFIVGLLIALSFSVVNFTGRVFMGFEMMGLGPGVGMLGIILFPIAYGIAAFVGAYVLALIYNWVAKKFGGIKVDI